jgi:5'-methylthioadenosine phosphorylase
MTLVPECVLAREAEICYASIASVTDYDVWKDQTVSTDEILKTMKRNVDTISSIIVDTINRLPINRSCKCNNALKDALI